MPPTCLNNQSGAGRDSKTLQYLTVHSEIAVTMDVCTHLELDDARYEIVRLKELEDIGKEINNIVGLIPITACAFSVPGFFLSKTNGFTPYPVADYIPENGHRCCYL